MARLTKVQKDALLELVQKRLMRTGEKAVEKIRANAQAAIESAVVEVDMTEIAALKRELSDLHKRQSAEQHEMTSRHSRERNAFENRLIEAQNKYSGDLAAVRIREGCSNQTVAYVSVAQHHHRHSHYQYVPGVEAVTTDRLALGEEPLLPKESAEKIARETNEAWATARTRLMDKAEEAHDAVLLAVIDGTGESFIEKLIPSPDDLIA
jgi:hypothetical protein